MQFRYDNCLVRVQQKVITIFPKYSTLKQALAESENGFQGGDYAEGCTISYDRGSYVKLYNIQSGKSLVNHSLPYDIRYIVSKDVVWSLSTFKFYTKKSRFGKTTYEAKVETLVEETYFTAKEIFLPSNNYRIDIK